MKKCEEIDYLIEDEFGKLLLELRITTGLNRKEFAEHLKIPYRTMQDWELGNNPMPEYVYRLIAYQVLLDDFFKKKKQDEKN